MAIKQLTSEQVRNWTLEQKDRWWRKEVFKGDMPQLTIRSALTGMILGSVLSLTNLYVGIRTGWTLGVGITSVILAFATFKILSKIGIAKEMTLLENNAMQSIATAAGYMTGPLVSSIAAYMLITDTMIPMYQTILWIIFLSLLGVLFAFPLKRRFINDEQMPFPEGRAAGVVMDSLHSETGAAGLFKAKILAIGAGVSALIEILRNDHFMSMIRAPFLRIPHYYDELIYRVATPSIFGTPLKDMTIRMDTSIVMVAAGGLMGIKTGLSLLAGAVINYFVLAPWLIQEKIIAEASFKAITMWALWGGVAMMTTASLFSFFSKPQVILRAFTSLLKKRSRSEDVLKDIELPMGVFLVGIPVVGGLCVVLAHLFFDVSVFMGILAIPLVFVFTLIAVNSTGLTSITPTGALGKLTQLTYSVIAPGNITTNIMTAGITGEVAGNASNLLMDIKPGYMLGGKPRHQAIGHVLGILAGSVVAVPVFYLILNNNISLMTSEKMPMPSAQIWRAVAEVLTQGLSFLHPSAQVAIVVGAVLGILFEIISIKTHGRFPISGVGMGLAFILPFADSLAMATGAILFWILKKKCTAPSSLPYRIFVENHETVCAGGIAGGALIGIVLIVLETVSG
ncbi:MAG: OPT/YSL family transporter [Deltaproteobacteria bacterium]|nr:OPT/YSL family transporter [Deltaproteobacteria bacterium]MBN2671482.1 OPT/YSL family transporter [Deltaproteobacteria bacterium]